MLDEREKNAAVTGHNDRNCSSHNGPWETIANHHQLFVDAANPTFDSIMFANVTFSSETTTATAGPSLVEQSQSQQQPALRTGKNMENVGNRGV
jgi:hypothetical protein